MKNLVLATSLKAWLLRSIHILGQKFRTCCSYHNHLGRAFHIARRLMEVSRRPASLRTPHMDLLMDDSLSWMPLHLIRPTLLLWQHGMYSRGKLLEYSPAVSTSYYLNLFFLTQWTSADFANRFLGALPQLDGTVKSKEFNLWTESYGGHYGPAVSPRTKFSRSVDPQVVALFQEEIEIVLSFSLLEANFLLSVKNLILSP